MLHWCWVDGDDDAIIPLNRACQEAPHPIEPKAPPRFTPWPKPGQPQEQPMQADPHSHNQQRDTHQQEAQRRIGRGRLSAAAGVSLQE